MDGDKDVLVLGLSVTGEVNTLLGRFDHNCSWISSSFSKVRE